MSTIIELNEVSKTFKGRTIFSNFSLTIEAGTFVTIVGESGCGKSTLLNLIGLLDKPDQGEIRIKGSGKFSKKQIMKLKRSVYGYVFQDYALIPDKTVKQNLEISLKYSKKNKDSIPAVLEQLKLDPSLIKKPVYTLSGGEQQRVAVARMLLKPCEIILADEPTGNLDKENGKTIIELFRKLQAEGKTVVCVTHDEDIAKESDRMIKLQKWKTDLPSRLISTQLPQHKSATTLS